MKNKISDDLSTELVRKGKFNASTGLLFFIINTITALILNPILVSFLGSYYFGIWRTIEKLIMFASVGDGQANQALKWTIAHDESSNDLDKKRRLVGSSLVIWVLFIPILLIILTAILYFFPQLINDLQVKDYSLIFLIILILGLNLIIKPLSEISSSVLIGSNKGYLVNYIKIIWLVIISIVTYIMIVYLDFHLFEMAISIFIVTVFRGIHYYLLAKKEIPWYGVRKPTLKEFKVFLSFSSWKLAWSFLEKFLMSSEVLFLSILIGAELVSGYIFTSYLAMAAILVVALLTSGFNPGIGRLIGDKNYEKSQIFIANQREYVLFFSTFIGGIILLFNESFVKLWGESELYLGSINNLLIVLMMIQLVLIRSEAFLIDLSLDIKNKVLLTLVSIILSSFLSILGYLYIYNSVSMIFLGLFLGRFLLLFIFPRLTNDMIKETKNFISLKSLFLVSLYLSLTYYIGTVQEFTHWYSFFFMGFFEFVFAFIFTYFALLSSSNQEYLKSLILKRIQK